MMKTMLLLAPMGSIHTRFNLANIEAIRQLNYKLTIVANFDVCDGPEKRNMLFAEKWKGEGIEVISFPFVRHSLLGNLRLISQLRKFLKERRFDFIHTHTETGGGCYFVYVDVFLVRNFIQFMECRFGKEVQ